MNRIFLCCHWIAQQQVPEIVWKRKEMDQHQYKAAAFVGKKVNCENKRSSEIHFASILINPRASQASSRLLGPRTQAHKCHTGFLCEYLSLWQYFSYFSVYTIWRISIIKTLLKVTQRTKLKSIWNEDIIFPVGIFWVRFITLAYNLHILCTIWQEQCSINQCHRALKFYFHPEDRWQPIVKLNLNFPKTVKQAPHHLLCFLVYKWQV